MRASLAIVKEFTQGIVNRLKIKNENIAGMEIDFIALSRIERLLNITTTSSLEIMPAKDANAKIEPYLPFENPKGLKIKLISLHKLPNIELSTLTTLLN